MFGFQLCGSWSYFFAVFFLRYLPFTIPQLRCHRGSPSGQILKDTSQFSYDIWSIGFLTAVLTSHRRGNNLYCFICACTTSHKKVIQCLPPRTHTIRSVKVAGPVAPPSSLPKEEVQQVIHQCFSSSPCLSALSRFTYKESRTGCDLTLQLFLHLSRCFTLELQPVATFNISLISTFGRSVFFLFCPLSCFSPSYAFLLCLILEKSLLSCIRTRPQPASETQPVCACGYD